MGSGTSESDRPKKKTPTRWQLQLLRDGLGLIPDGGTPRYIERTRFDECLTLRFFVRGVLRVQLDDQVLYFPIPAANYATFREWLGPPSVAQLRADLRWSSLPTMLLGAALITITWHAIIRRVIQSSAITEAIPLLGVGIVLVAVLSRAYPARSFFLVFAGCWAVCGALNAYLSLLFGEVPGGSRLGLGLWCIASAGHFLFAWLMVSKFRS